MPSIRITVIALALALLVSSAYASSFEKRQSKTKLDCTSCDAYIKGAIAVQTTPCSKFIQLSQCSATQKPVFVGCVNAMTAIGLFTKDQATTAVNASTAVCDALAANNTELINQFDSGIPATSCSNYASSPEVAAFQQYTSACTAYNAKIGDASRATNIKSAGGLALLVAGVFALL